MSAFGFMETSFFISLGISFVLILLLVYHFKQRLSVAENKLDTMFEIINNLAQELSNVKSVIMHNNRPSTPFPHNMVIKPNIPVNIPVKTAFIDGGKLEEDNDNSESEYDSDSDSDDEDSDDEKIIVSDMEDIDEDDISVDLVSSEYDNTNEEIANPEIVNNEEPIAKQLPSMGCNIKWKVGEEPDYFLNVRN